MSEKRLSNIESDIKLIKAALLGPEGNADEGVLAITRKTEHRVTKLETERSTIWAAIVAIPIIAAAVAIFMPDTPTFPRNQTHQ